MSIPPIKVLFASAFDSEGGVIAPGQTVNQEPNDVMSDLFELLTPQVEQHFERWANEPVCELPIYVDTGNFRSDLFLTQKLAFQLSQMELKARSGAEL